jgi:hypothetical protein
MGVAAACVSLGCNGDGEESNRPGEPRADGSAATGGEPFVAGAPVTTYEATIGPVSVPSGGETTRCVVRRLGNASPVFVRRFRSELSQGTHHFIVYRSSATEESLEPTECPGFSGFGTGEPPIYIAQQGAVDLAFPNEGDRLVGLELLARQMVRIEIHFLNVTSTEAVMQGTASMDSITPDHDVLASDVAFWGTTHLNAAGDPPTDFVPAHSQADTGVMFQPGLAETKIFALTTHQHWLGRRMRIWSAADTEPSDPPLADCADWSNPRLVVLFPPLDLPANDGSELSARGLAYRCEYENGTASDVPFGESGKTNEMCFLWHYYYPSHGLHYCVDGQCGVPQ